jgi:hypothetical protein
MAFLEYIGITDSVMIGSSPMSTRAPSPFAPTPELFLEDHLPRSTSNSIKCPIPHRGRLMEMIKTGHGSRLQQEQLTKSSDPKYVQRMADEMLSSNGLVEATLDKFGNYYVQALVQVVDDKTVLRIANALTASELVTIQVEKPIQFSDLCAHSYGSHVVQVLIGRAESNKALAMKLIDAFLSNIAKIAVDFLGSICLIQALKKLSGVSRLVAGLAPFTRSLAQSRHGHAVVIEALDHASSQTLGVMEKELVGDMDQMVGNDFSFRVLVHALEMEKAGKISPKHSRVRLFVENLNYNQKCFRLIDYLLRNFAEHEIVNEELIPKVVQIVQLGYVPQTL